MKYLCLVYGEEQKMATVPDNECLAWGETLLKSGHYLAAEALQPVRTATTVRVREGKRPLLTVRLPRPKSIWPGSI